MPLGQISAASYDLLGQKTSETDYNGRTTRYRYDELGNLLENTLPDGATIAYTYTKTGLRETMADARGTINTTVI